MMQPHPGTLSRLPAGWMPLLVSTTLIACASSTQVRYDQARQEIQQTVREPAAAEVVLDGPSLDRAALIRAVLARNPSLDAARAAWTAALEEAPQAEALPDPMAEYSFAPLSITSSDVHYGQVISLSQALPWPGKLALRGRMELAMAEVAAADYREARLRLALSASTLFDDYFAIARSLEVTERHAGLVKDIQAIASAQYEAGRGAQQDVLQADVELAHVEHQQVVLHAQRAVTLARINGLLHRRPDASLPPPPAELEHTGEAPRALDALLAIALEQRPELSAQRARIEASESAVKLADREFYPDFRVMGSYNSMWPQTEHQWMLGVGVDLPIWRATRHAAGRGAQARLLGGEAQLAAAADEIRAEVAIALARLEEAQHVLHLYRERLLPSAEAQIEAAQFGYQTGGTGFQALIDAERGLLRLRLEEQLAIATRLQRRAELDRAIGVVPGFVDEEAKQ